MAKTLNVFNKISSLRERYYKASVGKEDLLHLIAETEVMEQVYNSNAIENSTLTLEETEKILLQIDLDRFITEREIFEAKNLARVVSYIDKKAKEKELTFDVILFLHKMLLSNIRDEVAGRFRKDDEYVRVGSHIAPQPKEVIDRLEKIFVAYNASSHENIIKRIARLHLAFEHTHPFIDGNGDFWLDVDAKDEAKAKPIVDAHNGTTVAPEPTITQKLASVGLSIDDLKIALGL
jgi:Fic family protein